MRFGVETITPERARDLLSRDFEGNRNIRQSYVKQLKAAMEDGGFVSMNGQTIVVGDADGVLYDGQHRLSAIAESGIQQQMLVVYVDNAAEAFKTIDNGTKRKASDFIELKNATVCSVYSTTMVAFGYGTANLANALNGLMGGCAVPRHLVLDYCSANSEVVEADCIAAKKAGKRCGKPSAGTFAKFMALVRFTEKDSALDSFMEDLARALPENSNSIVVRDALRNAYIGRSASPSTMWCVGTLLQSYEAFASGDVRMKLNRQDRMLEKFEKLMFKKRAELARVVV